MKKNMLLVLGIALALLSACGAPASDGYVPPAESVDTAVVSEPAFPPGSNNEIFIPGSKQTAPNGILEQLSWFGGGGGLTDRACGECQAYIHENNLEIINFKPYQNLKLIFYRRNGGLNACGFGVADFVTIAEVQVDENGSLTVPLRGDSDEEKLFVNTVIDIDSGQVEIPGSTGLNTSCSIDNSSSCPGAPQQKVQNGSSAHVCTQQDHLTVRSKPQIGGSEILKLETGTMFNIVGGPKCSDGFSWWKIDVNGTTGWVAEGGDEVDPYFICPAQ